MQRILYRYTIHECAQYSLVVVSGLLLFVLLLWRGEWRLRNVDATYFLDLFISHLLKTSIVL
jgi:hypothetical protein